MNNTPIILLSGFLGSGKTTLLAHMLERVAGKGLRPAIIMNELGEVNFDGQLLNGNVPMREMLSGCICCTIRGDLGLELQRLIAEEEPDIIFIESTGVANPMEILDAVTDTALLLRMDIRSLITIVDVAHFLKWHRQGKGKTYRLMMDQIRCASTILLNKSDQVQHEIVEEVQHIIQSANAKANLYTTSYCEVAPMLMDKLMGQSDDVHWIERNSASQVHTSEHEHDHHTHDHAHEHHGHTHGHHEHSYDHVMVYTHYFEEPMGDDWFDRMAQQLPEGVYRAKGIFTGNPSGQRKMFHYAYQQLEIFPIHPQGEVQDVAVFMGEQILANELKEKIMSINRY